MHIDICVGRCIWKYLQAGWHLVQPTGMNRRQLQRETVSVHVLGLEGSLGKGHLPLMGWISQSFEKRNSCMLAIQCQIIPRNVQWAHGKDWFTLLKEEQTGGQTWFHRDMKAQRVLSMKEFWNRTMLDTQPLSYTETLTSAYRLCSTKFYQIYFCCNLSTLSGWHLPWQTLAATNRKQ